LAFALSVIAIAGTIAVVLLRRSALARAAFGWSFLWTSTWDPVALRFGALPFIYGTLATTAIAIAIALPLGLGAAVCLAELMPRRDALGDGARRGRPVRTLGHPGLGLPRAGARARGDDGGDDGDRQPARALRLALRPCLHDGGGAGQRVHRGDERRLPRRAGRDRARAVRDHARGERARAAADRQRPDHARRPAPM